MAWDQAMELFPCRNGGFGRLPLIKDIVAAGGGIGQFGLLRCVLRSPKVSPESVQSFIALGIGFAFAGMISSAYQLFTRRPASFRLLQHGPHPKTFAAVPFLVFAAPFIIMRNTVRGRRIEHRRFEFVMLATIIAGIWSLMSGTVVVMAVAALGHMFA
jgi:O-antigen/teichoic acid export membrane protein